MPLYQAIIMAVIQGVTEFLPVSSTAHLVLFPWLLGWNDGGLAFDVALHAGTLLAVLLYFLKDWIELTLTGVGMHYPSTATAEQVQTNRRLFWLLVVGTIPGAIVGYKFEHVIEGSLRKPLPIAVALILVALVLWWADRIAGLERHIGQANWLDAIFIGCAQALALFPGVSRSGITITAGLICKMTRESAARFSFLLSTPLIAGAAAKGATQANPHASRRHLGACRSQRFSSALRSRGSSATPSSPLSCVICRHAPSRYLFTTESSWV